MIAASIYILCFITSFTCAVMLMRAYRKTQSRMLFWSQICFWGLALNNILLFIDLVVTPPDVDLSPLRTFVGFISVSLLVYGLIMESK